jgi:hypothetical protein
MNEKIRTEAPQFLFGEYINRIFFAVCRIHTVLHISCFFINKLEFVSKCAGQKFTSRYIPIKSTEKILPYPDMCSRLKIPLRTIQSSRTNRRRPILSVRTITFSLCPAKSSTILSVLLLLQKNAGKLRRQISWPWRH